MQPPTHRVKITGSQPVESRVWGMGGYYNTIERSCFDYGRFPDNNITPRHPPNPRQHRLSSSEPTQVTDFSVLPTMGGFYRGKVGGRY